MEGFRRRELLALALAVVGAPAVAVARGEPSEAAAIRGLVEALFSDLEAARGVGRSYLARVPGMRDRDLLRDAGVASWPLPSRSRAHLLCAVAERRRAQFRDGETVIVEGWVLARCEASLCALAARHSGAA